MNINFLPTNNKGNKGVKASVQIGNHSQSVDRKGCSMLSFNVDRSVILNEIPHDRCITVSDILKATRIPLQQTTSPLITNIRNGRGYRESSAERL